MRIWDIDPSLLCVKHLYGEHRELHAIWTIITEGRKSSYAHHPETKRWVGHLGALYERHEALVAEMHRRGYTGHKTPLIKPLKGFKQPNRIESVESQIQNIKGKGCSS